MANMRHFLAAVLCISLSTTALSSSSGYKVTYDGGSVPEKTGAAVYLYIEANQARLVKDGAVLAVIPVSAVTEISYGQDVHRRVGTAIGLAVVSLGIGALML
jgi:hypothetical protein